MNNYDDIINYNYTGSKRGKMSLYERSAQFAPFQSLEGYVDSVRETERLTKKRIELDDEKKEMINNKILYLYNNGIEGEYTYFIKDTRKSGGSYKKEKGIIKKIDEINMILYFYDGIKIFINDIVEVEY